MAGIYIHIPFCKTRCIYCDFYSTTLSEFKGRYIQNLCRELEIRRDYLQGAPIETIYLGGGTPSQLTQEDFLQIFETIERVYGMKQVREITLEANPDDLTPEYTRMLATCLSTVSAWGYRLSMRKLCNCLSDVTPPRKPSQP